MVKYSNGVDLIEKGISMFRVGDIVWAKVNMYSVTFYHRPCKVLSRECEGIRVEVLDNGSRFIVDKDMFELVPPGGILYPGDKLFHNKLREILTFKGYFDSGKIRCENSNNMVFQYDIREVQRLGGFYV